MKLKLPSLIPCTLAFAILIPVVAAAQGMQLRVVSNPRPEFVSGGDVLVSVQLPAGVQTSAVRLTLNGSDVTSSLRADAGGRTMTALVKGLVGGSNALAASAGNANAKLTVMNHPSTGPVISGPQEQPFVCETEKFNLVAGGTAGKPLDANCSIATRVDYVYKSTAVAPAGAGRGNAAPTFKPLPDPKAVPADVATVTNSLGVQVPFIVRVETGTINRGVYEIAMLFNPARDAQPDFMTKPAGWNGRVIYTFGGGCAGGWYKQGTGTGGVDDEVMLQQGYAVVSNSLNVFGNNCAELLSVETMMMTKEHFIEAYGAPVATIGWGGSGGSYQQHQIADGYPGLLDGIMPARSFPDLEFGTVPMVSDARLLANYFDKLAGPVTYTDEQKRQIAGLGQLVTLKNNGLNPGRITVGEFCPSVPEAQRYDKVKNPTGVRCSVYDHAVNVWGRDPKTGFARRPLDNVGIQYGLAMLDAGVISKEQFLDLNEKIGGYDNDGQIAATRSVADPAAARIAYRMGRLTSGGGGLATTPIIDYRAYLDDAMGGNVHLKFHSYSMKDRLMKANGYNDNHVMLTDDRKWGDNLGAPVLRQALAQMDQWVTKIAQDTSSDSKIVKLRRAKPADLVDACWTRDDKPQKIAEKQTLTGGKCNELYPGNSFPRGVAGSPVAADVIKCQLMPVNPSTYKVTFTADETARLKRIFAGGVCDWSKPGIEQQPMAGTWQVIAAPPAPASTARR